MFSQNVGGYGTNYENLVLEYGQGWEEVHASINHGKNTALFLYTDVLIMLAAVFRATFGVPCRQRNWHVFISKAFG